MVARKRVAETVDDAVKLVEAGFEYVTDMDNKKLFKKRKSNGVLPNI